MFVANIIPTPKIMDIKTILISDQIDPHVIERLQEANLQVDYHPLITPEKLKESIKVSVII